MTKHISLDLETWGTTPGSDIRSIGATVFDSVAGQVSIPCQYCQNGQYTGLPGNACENCMNTGMTDGYGSTFYIACDNPMIAYRPMSIPPEPVYRYPLHRDPRTVQWWSEQSDEAQAAFTDPVDLREALVRLTRWLDTVTASDRPIEYPSQIAGLTDPMTGETEMIDIQAHGRVHDQPVPLVKWDGLRIWSHGAAFDPPILAAAYEAVGLPVPWHYRAPRDTRTLFDVAGIEDHSAWLLGHADEGDVFHHALGDAIVQARAVCAAWQLLHPS